MSSFKNVNRIWILSSTLISAFPIHTNVNIGSTSIIHTGSASTHYTQLNRIETRESKLASQTQPLLIRPHLRYCWIFMFSIILANHHYDEDKDNNIKCKQLSDNVMNHTTSNSLVALRVTNTFLALPLQHFESHLPLQPQETWNPCPSTKDVCLKASLSVIYSILFLASLANHQNLPQCHIPFCCYLCSEELRADV